MDQSVEVDTSRGYLVFVLDNDQPAPVHPLNWVQYSIEIRTEGTDSQRRIVIDHDPTKYKWLGPWPIGRAQLPGSVSAYDHKGFHYMLVTL
jgi:hypothetical protein